jgi:hypothetical protein
VKPHHAWLWISLLSSGCARGVASEGDIDAGATPAPLQASPQLARAAEDPLARLSRIPAFATRLGRGVHLAPIERGYRVASLPTPARTGFRGVGEEALDATLPARADGPTHLAVRGVEGAWIEITPVGLTAVDARVDEGALVFPEVARSTALVLAADRGRVEELRWLRDAQAETTLRWRLRRGPAIERVAARDGRIEAVVRGGHWRLASEEAFAVDAAGTRRALSVRIAPSAEPGVDEIVAELDARGLTHPIAVDPAWTSLSSMSTARGGGASAVLADGRFLAAGGNDASLSYSVAEIYDPKTGAWTTTTPMNAARWYPSAVRLADGRVLVVAGVGVGAGNSEIYDPTSKSWGNIALLSISRGGFTTLATDPVTGSVYCAGSQGGTTAFERYDPATNTWTARAPMTIGRSNASMYVLSAERKVLVAGTKGAALQAELYDIATNTWSSAGTLSSLHEQGPMVRLASGKVLLAAGYTTVTEQYDPVANAWTRLADANVGHTGFVWSWLPSGKLLAAGGYDAIAASEIYTPSTNTWASISPLKQARYDAFFGSFSDGSVIVAGGRAGPTYDASTELFQFVAGGQACTIAADCASGFCVDGVCCDRACTATCESCNQSGKAGTCTAIASGAPAHGSCAPYATCASGACASTCATTADCASTSYCKAPSCVARVANGTSCTAGEQCLSGSCVDGVCCDRACGGQCEACDLAGHVGTCTTLTSGAPHGARPACSGTAVGTTCGSQCAGTSATACSYPTKTAPCSANACASGIETHASFCDGAGKCNDVARSCGAFVCDGTGVACKTVCTTPSDCAAGFWCTVGVCVPVADLGKECTSSAMCSTGNCVDGVCCATASCGAGSSCANVGHRGSCTKTLGTACTSGAECGSGFCVDGVCCGGECAGQCEACDVPGRVGTCWPVAGDPHGARAKCSDGGGDVCRALTCNGAKDALKCADFKNGAETTCKPASCAAATFTATSYCDGAGTCRGVDAKSCAPYACAGAACATRCDADTDCADGNVCKEHACVPNTARCTSDGLASIDDGVVKPCGNYRCANGVCATNCSSTDDCAPGATCDGGVCVQTATTAGDGGGCDVGTGGEHGLGAGLALGAMIALASIGRARRRR